MGAERIWDRDLDVRYAINYAGEYPDRGILLVVLGAGECWIERDEAAGFAGDMRNWTTGANFSSFWVSSVWMPL